MIVVSVVTTSGKREVKSESTTAIKKSPILFNHGPFIDSPEKPKEFEKCSLTKGDLALFGELKPLDPPVNCVVKPQSGFRV